MKNNIKKKLELLLDKVGDPALRRRARKIILATDPKEGERILDVGCGDGFYLYLLSNLGIKLHLFGSDLDPNALISAKQILAGKNIKLGQGDLMKGLSFKEGYFDKIIMSEVVEHLPNDVKGLKEVFRILKPGGVLCLSVPNANYPLFWDPVNRILEDTGKTHIKSGFWAGIWNQHIRLYSPELIQKVVEKAGFQAKIVESVTWWCLPFSHNLINLAARIVYSQKVTKISSDSVSKYSNINKKRSPLIELGFGLIRFIDSINEIYQPKKRGAGVFVKAVKQ